MAVRFDLYSPRDWSGLLEMYLSFEPKAAYQGLPPFKETVTRRWLSGLVGNPRNTNFILERDGKLIAHVALVYYPNFPVEQELIIFVHQDHRHRGWGRQLLVAAMNWACRRLKLQRVWLKVDLYNAPARRLYTRIGFVPVPSVPDGTEIDMVRPLGCRECSETHCPIFRSELIRRLGLVEATSPAPRRRTKSPRRV